MLVTLEITGLRGFASTQTLTLARPNGTPGSGLTVIVGANNAGKSTIIEALRAIAQTQPPSFSQGRRNQAAGDQVIIRASDIDGRQTTLKSIRPGSSETEYTHLQGGLDTRTIRVLPSRRVFNPYFSRNEIPRELYMTHVIGFPPQRTSSLDQFAYRLFSIEKHRPAFDDVLRRVLDPVPDWSIDQMDNGQYFLKIRKGTTAHSSEGLGEGLISLLYIIDALYDSREGDIIAIDEPELSLHPALQRKLCQLFIEHSATRQIVLSTHSPYFVGLDALLNGSTVVRVYADSEGSKISQPTSETARSIFGLLRNENNPHVFGLVAQEIFFVDDRIILVEGQEDVVFYKRVEKAVEPLTGTFFGWGVGGADNMELISTVLRELRYQKVVGILDGDRAELAHSLSEKFPSYHFFAIPAPNIRTKDSVPSKPPITGLLDEANKSVRPEYIDEVRRLFREANRYLNE